MSVTIHCVRHGQGLHNVGAGNYLLPDPKLTEMGEEQCFAVREKHFPEQSRISLVAASPLCRTIHSASLIFQPALKSVSQPMSILAIPDAQETSDDPCDIGSDPEVLQVACEENRWPANLSLVKVGWNDKSIGARYSPESAAIGRRASDTRRFLRQKARDLIESGCEDVHIALVSHGGFLHYFAEDWEDAYKYPATGWTNCETRSYIFTHDIANDDDTNAGLMETTESRRKRGLNYPMFPRERQSQLFSQSMQAWEDQGLQNPLKVHLRNFRSETATTDAVRNPRHVPCVEVGA